MKIISISMAVLFLLTNLSYANDNSMLSAGSRIAGIAGQVAGIEIPAKIFESVRQKSILDLSALALNEKEIKNKLIEDYSAKQRRGEITADRLRQIRENILKSKLFVSTNETGDVVVIYLFSEEDSTVYRLLPKDARDSDVFSRAFIEGNSDKAEISDINGDSFEAYRVYDTRGINRCLSDYYGAAVAIPASVKKEKNIFFFGTDTRGNNLTEGDISMKDLLGGKGAGLAEMARLTYELDGERHPIDVPAGFTITTDEAKQYFREGERLRDDLIADIRESMKKLEEMTGRQFGEGPDPLILSIRSGAKISMPGMMDTILNVGLNDKTVDILARKTNARFAWDSYRRLVMMFGEVVLGLKKEEFDAIMDKVKAKKAMASYGKIKRTLSPFISKIEKMFGITLLLRIPVSDTDLTVDELKKIVEDFKGLITSKGKEFPQEVEKQLLMAVEAVFKSSNNERAIAYRRLNKIPQDVLSAVNVQSMVFGNLNTNSATGVAFTRDPITGENVFFGEWLREAQGEDVVDGSRTPMPITNAGKEKFKEEHPDYKGEVQSLEEAMPGVYKQLVAIYRRLEERFNDMQEMEFTIQDGRLFLLQTRTGKRTGTAAMNIIMDLLESGKIDEETAVLRMEPKQIDQLLNKTFDPDDRKKAKAAKQIMTKGLAASPGAAVGRVVFSSAEVKKIKAENPDAKVILVRHETSGEDTVVFSDIEGVLTTRGGMTSHAAVIARSMGITAVVGAKEIEIGRDSKGEYFVVKGRKIRKGEEISIDGYSGEVISRAVRTVKPPYIKAKEGGRLEGNDLAFVRRFNKFLDIVDKYRGKVRANAERVDEKKHDVRAAFDYFNADGIGLVRSEHMFFNDRTEGENRILKFQKMILSDRIDEGVLSELSQYQTGDYEEILKYARGNPITVRLLDPPLHEFLPEIEKIDRDAEVKRAVKALAKELNKTKSEVIRLIKKKKKEESNPMAGLRGDRLLMLHPKLAEMQIRAILKAYQATKATPSPVSPIEIMIPFVGSVEEFVFFEDLVNKIASAEFEYTRGTEYLIGTMIETPAACVLAGEIAEHADFFSFGTNDLTQFALRFSRDDAGNTVIPAYMDENKAMILKADPFVTIDEIVGELINIAVTLGRQKKPGLKCGICGEHGGDPDSINDVIIPAGLDYASCSPFRVLGAKLASAQKRIKDKRAEKKSVVPYDLNRIKIETVEIKPANVEKTEDIMVKDERRDLMRRMVLASLAEKDDKKSEAKGRLTSFLTSDFRDILARNSGAFIELYRYSLSHVFDGIKEDDIRRLAREIGVEKTQIRTFLKSLHEANPELANFGARQALTGFQDIFEAQLNALANVLEGNKDYRPSVVVPVLIDPQEFKEVKGLVSRVMTARRISAERILLGACIETPRAALIAGDYIREGADFVIFDTIGLTESVLAMTKEDSAAVVGALNNGGVYVGKNPLSVIPESVARFIGIAATKAKQADQSKPIYTFGHGEIPAPDASFVQIVNEKKTEDKKEPVVLWELDIEEGKAGEERTPMKKPFDKGSINGVIEIIGKRHGRGMFAGIDMVRVVGTGSEIGDRPFPVVVEEGSKRVLYISIDVFRQKARFIKGFDIDNFLHENNAFDIPYIRNTEGQVDFENFRKLIFMNIAVLHGLIGEIVALTPVKDTNVKKLVSDSLSISEALALGTAGIDAPPQDNPYKGFFDVVNQMRSLVASGAKQVVDTTDIVDACFEQMKTNPTFAVLASEKPRGFFRDRARDEIRRYNAAMCVFNAVALACGLGGTVNGEMAGPAEKVVPPTSMEESI